MFEFEIFLCSSYLPFLCRPAPNPPSTHEYDLSSTLTVPLHDVNVLQAQVARRLVPEDLLDAALEQGRRG